MKLVALEVLPNRVQAGETFEVNEVQAKILISAGVAKLSDEDEDEDEPKRTRRTYRRRDIRAEP